MSRVKMDNLSKKQKIQLIGELYDSLGEVKNREEASEIFRDLFTTGELVMMSRRIQIAFLIQEGYTTRKITNLLDVSNSTVTRVRKKINRHGKGFKLMKRNFKRIQKQRSKKKAPRSKLSSHPYKIAENMGKMLGYSVFALLDWIKKDKQKNYDQNQKEN